MSIVNPPPWLDPTAFPCSSCGAAAGEPCVTMRKTFGPGYKGAGRVCVGYVHAPRGYAALAERRRQNTETGEK